MVFLKTLPAPICLRSVCECVFETEREREKERKKERKKGKNEF